MKQTLSLKLGQQLTMTPQLQQAIRLLQLSSLDLQQEIQEALESNPMLELEEESGDQADDAGEDGPAGEDGDRDADYDYESDDSGDADYDDTDYDAAEDGRDEYNG